MKRVLLLSSLFIAISISGKLNAQCGVFNVGVSLTSAEPDPTISGNCKITFDVSFNISNNPGNKYIFMHLWRGTDYGYSNHAYEGLNGRTLDQLDGDDVANSGTADDDSHPPVSTIALNNATSALTYTTYFDPLITPNTTGGLSRVAQTFIGNGVSYDGYLITLSGVTVSVPGGCAGLVLQGDVWSSQSNSGSPKVHCLSAGIGFIGDPTIRGQIACFNPRQFQLLLSTVATVPINTTYNIYIDNGTIGVKDGVDKLAYSETTPFELSSSQSYNSGYKNYNYNSIKPDADQPLLVEVFSSTSTFSKTSYGTLENGCIPLPVTFSNFHAHRNRDKVSLKWETLSEQNNRGFNVQRNTRGVWKTVAFVFSQADGGNNDELLTYEYKDANSEKGVSQYRIQQVDLDGKASHSAIRSVKGLEQAGTRTVVYPNPSGDGKVNVVFEDQGAKAVTVSDISGRVVRQYRNVLNNVQIEELESGMYSIQITDLSSAVSSTEKVIIKKR